MPAYDAAAWTDFAAATAGAAAALAGLLFVAVSINLTQILATDSAPGRAAEALVMLSSPVIITLTVLIPGQPEVALGVELLVISAVLAPALAWLARPSRRSSAQPWFAWLLSNVLPAAVLGVGPVLAGIGLLTESIGGLYWLPAAIVLALVGGIANAWVLLIEILR